MSEKLDRYSDYQRPAGGFAGDPLCTKDRYEKWVENERLADALEEAGVHARKGVRRLISARRGIAVDIDRYANSPVFRSVAREYYRPTMKAFGRFERDNRDEYKQYTAALSALSGKVAVGVREDEVRAAMGFSKRKLSEMIRRMRNEGWSDAGCEIVLVREEHSITDDGADDEANWADYPHYHVIFRVRRGRGSKALLRRFVERMRAMWTRALELIDARYHRICRRNQEEVAGAFQYQEVRKLAKLRCYLAKAPRIPAEAGKEAVQWVHQVITGRDQLTATLSFKQYKRRALEEKAERQATNPIVESPSGDVFYRIENPGTDVSPRARHWREQLDLDETLEEWLTPRAHTLYDWATHADVNYRNRLCLDQDVMDLVCDILGVDYVSAPGISIQPAQRPQERSTPVPVGDHWHGPQNACVQLQEGDPPPF